jgi:hypothetical protein
VVKKRAADSRQLGLFAPEPFVAPVATASREPSERERIVAQIVRDERVASGPEEYHEPSRQFYLDRAASYREYLSQLQ